MKKARKKQLARAKAIEARTASRHNEAEELLEIISGAIRCVWDYLEIRGFWDAAIRLSANLQKLK